MSLERARITFEPRNVLNCLDLAVRFAGRRIVRVLAFCTVIAVPCCLIVYYLTRNYEMDFRLAALVVFAATSPLGVLLSLDAIPSAMGEPESRKAYLNRLRRLGPKLVGKGLGLRALIGAGSALCVIPGIVLALRSGFFIERECLAETESWDAQRRVERLLKESWRSLLERALWIGVFTALLSLSLFLLVDYTAGLFGIPIFVDRIADAMPSYDRNLDIDPVPIFDDIAYLVWNDSLVLTALTAVALFVYPIARLAWFFCYVDVRVRRDLWDTELEFARLASRLAQRGGERV